MHRLIVKRLAMYRFLMVLTIAATAGLQIWRTLFNNFAVEVAGLDGYHVGILQSVREVPGYLMIDYRIVFICGAIMSLISLIAVQNIKTEVCHAR